MKFVFSANILCGATGFQFPGFYYVQNASNFSESNFAKHITSMWKGNLPQWVLCLFEQASEFCNFRYNFTECFVSYKNTDSKEIETSLTDSIKFKYGKKATTFDSIFQSFYLGTLHSTM